MKLELKEGQKLFFISDTHFAHNNICRATTKWDTRNDLTRDFKSLELMNQTIIERINAVVGEDDILFHLGDWSFGGIEQIWKFRKQIFCKNIHLILGNHDHHIEDNKILPGIYSDLYGNIQEGDTPWKHGNNEYDLFGVESKSLFKSVNNYLKLDVVFPHLDKTQKRRKKSFILCHYPITSWHDMNQGNIHLFGHVHLPPKHKLREGKGLDVGWDGSGGVPYNVEDILRIMEHQPIKKITLPQDHHEKVI